MYRLQMLVALFLVTSFATAAVKTESGTTDSGAWGRNRINQTVAIFPLTIYTYKNDDKGRRTDEIISKVPFNDECVWLGPAPGEEAHALDCRGGKASPLAGTYFSIRFSKSHKNVCGRGSSIFECTINCTSRKVPKVFVEDPYEC